MCFKDSSLDIFCVMHRFFRYRAETDKHIQTRLKTLLSRLPSAARVNIHLMSAVLVVMESDYDVLSYHNKDITLLALKMSTVLVCNYKISL